MKVPSGAQCLSPPTTPRWNLHFFWGVGQAPQKHAAELANLGVNLHDHVHAYLYSHARERFMLRVPFEGTHHGAGLLTNCLLV
jgi:hypothetical protein